MVHIITDTTSGLEQEIAQKYDIPVIPQVIHFGQESFLECQEMDSAMFMERLVTSDVLPQTAAPPPELYYEHFERFGADGEPILCIHPSSKVSGTVRSAQVAKQDFPDLDIRVMDTMAIGGPLAWMVIRAAEWANEGLTAEVIWYRLETIRSNICSEGDGLGGQRHCSATCFIFVQYSLGRRDRSSRLSTNERAKEHCVISWQLPLSLPRAIAIRCSR